MRFPSTTVCDSSSDSCSRSRSCSCSCSCPGKSGYPSSLRGEANACAGLLENMIVGYTDVSARCRSVVQYNTWNRIMHYVQVVSEAADTSQTLTTPSKDRDASSWPSKEYAIEDTPLGLTLPPQRIMSPMGGFIALFPVMSHIPIPWMNPTAHRVSDGAIAMHKISIWAFAFDCSCVQCTAPPVTSNTLAFTRFDTARRLPLGENARLNAGWYT